MSESESLAQVVVIVPNPPVPAVVQNPVVDPVVEEPVQTVEIVEEEVPLAVVEETEVIEEEEAPLADKPADSLKNWWWWVAAGVAGIAGKGAYDANRRKRNKNRDDK